MTIPLLTLILVVMLLGLVLSTVRHLAHASLEGRLDPRSAVSTLSSPETYRPLNRLFTPEDTTFVTKNGEKLQGRLRESRNRVMRLYLQQIRTDFNKLWRLARYIAPVSTNPDFAALVTRQFCVFHFLLAAARLRAVFGLRFPIPVHVSRLVSAMELLRAGVVRTVAEIDPVNARAALTRG